MPKHTIVLIPGDGIGPEVTVATQRVLSEAGLDVEWVELPAGAVALEQGYDNVLPQRTLAAITAHKVALKGPVTRRSARGSPASTCSFARSSTSTRPCGPCAICAAWRRASRTST